MELPTEWGNVKCTDRVGGVGWCNGRCDRRSVWRSMWRSMVVWEGQFRRVSPNTNLQASCRCWKIQEKHPKYWAITNHGTIAWFLGLQIKRDWKNKTLSINQHMYIESLAEKFQLTNAKLSGDTLQTCLSQTTTPQSHPLPVTVSVRHTLRHILRLSHVPLHYPTPPTPSIHFTFPHTVGNSIPVEQLYLCHYLCYRLRYVLYHSIVLLLSLFLYLYNL